MSDTGIVLILAGYMNGYPAIGEAARRRGPATREWWPNVPERRSRVAWDTKARRGHLTVSPSSILGLSSQFFRLRFAGGSSVARGLCPSRQSGSVSTPRTSPASYTGKRSGATGAPASSVEAFTKGGLGHWASGKDRGPWVVGLGSWASGPLDIGPATAFPLTVAFAFHTPQ